MRPSIRSFATVAALVSLACASALAFQDAKPEAAPPAAATTPATLPAAPGKVGKLPYLSFDSRTREIRVEAETLAVDTPLEFFAVVFNGPEHEAIVRSRVKPSDLHTALLAVGLKPGAPVTYSKAANKWVPPHGPPLQIQMEYTKAGKLVSEPASRWMRNMRTKQPMPVTTWIFAGSRVMNDGNYAADSTGYLISVVNFDMTVIDIPDLASASNEALEWERNPETVPPAGTKVTMVLRPAGKELTGAPQDAAKPAGPPALAAAAQAAPASDAVAVANAGPEDRPAPASTQSGRGGEAGGVSDVELDEQLIARATKKWEQVVAPKAAALREAAQAHYDTLNALRREQQRLIDEADRVQRAIDRLERQYQDMTTPQPALDADAATGDAPADAAQPPADAP